MNTSGHGWTRIAALGAACILLLAGVGCDDTPIWQQKRVAMYRAFCAKYYECFSDDSLDVIRVVVPLIGHSESECLGNYADGVASRTEPCSGGAIYNEEAMDQCVAAWETFSCEALYSDTLASPEVCSDVCRMP